MGYETKLYFAEVYPGGLDVFLGNDFTTIFPLAMVDLAKAGYETETGLYLSAQRKAETEQGVFYGFYGTDGDTMVTEDRYGARMTRVDLWGLLKAMEADQADEDYRRFALAIVVIKQFLENPQWKDGTLICVQYGH